MKKILLSSVAAFTITSSGAYAFTANDDIQQRTSFGEEQNCTLVINSVYSAKFTFLQVFNSSGTEYGTAGGSYWTYGNRANYSLINEQLIANCFSTNIGNIQNLTQNGAELNETYDTDTTMFFSFTLAQATPTFQPGTYTYSIQGTNGQVITDTTPPTVSLSPLSGPTNGKYTTQITLSEDSTNFDISDLSILNASALMTGQGTNYQVTLTPNDQGQVSIGVNANTFTDLAGNPNTAGTAVTANYDSVGPTVTYDSFTGPINGVYTLTVKVSEPTTDLTTSDLIFENSTGTLSGNGLVYTILLTPKNDGIFKVEIPIASFSDAAGNTNSERLKFIAESYLGAPVLTSPGIVRETTDMDRTTKSLHLTQYGSVTDNIDTNINIIYKIDGQIVSDIYHAPLGTTHVTMDAVDSSNNKAEQVSFDIIITDEQIPEITVHQNFVDLGTDLDSMAARVSMNTLASAFDAVDGPLSVSYTANGMLLGETYDFPIGTTSVTAQAMDKSGNTAQPAFITVQVNDTQAPKITTLDDFIIQTEERKSTRTLDVTATASVRDNSGENLSATYKIDNNEITGPYVFPLGETTVKVNSSDSSGNYAEKTFTITIADKEGPQLEAVVQNIIVETDIDTSTATIDLKSNIIARDNVDTNVELIFLINGTPITGSSYAFPIGATEVFVKATDSNGNKADPLFLNVIVSDGQEPVITAPGNQTVPTDPEEKTALIDVTGLGSVSDNVNQNIEIVYTINENVITGPYLFPIGTTTVMMNAVDSARNAATQASFTITVSDVGAPVIRVPHDMDFTTDAGKATITADITTLGDATDAVDGPLPITYTIGETTVTGDYVFPLGSTTVTMTATDAAQNKSSATFKVNVTDANAPVITAPKNQTVSTDPEEKTAIVDVIGLGSVSDNVDQNIQIVYTINENVITGPYLFPIGTTTVMMNAVDSARNAATQASFTITVSDVGAPVIRVPHDMDFTTDAGKATITADITTLGDATDAVDGPLPITYTIGETTVTGDYVFPLGSTTVTMTATDAAQNKSSATFKVNVTDANAPVITAPKNVSLTTDIDKKTAAFDVTTLGSATDNVDKNLTILYTIGAKNIAGVYDFPIGITTVMMNAIDSAQNSAPQVAFTVTVSDAGSPVIMTPENQTASTDKDLNTATINVTTLGSASDAVDGTVPVTYTIGSTPLTGPYAFPVGVTTITMNAVDKNGNEANPASFTVTVKDVTAPFTPQKPLIVANADRTITVSGVAEPDTMITVTFPDQTSASVKADKNGSYTLTSKNAQPNGNVMVTAQDAAGNISDAVLTAYEMADDVAPEMATSIKMIVNPNSSITLTGRAEFGSIVRIVFPDSSIQMIKADIPNIFGNLGQRGNASGVTTTVSRTLAATSAGSFTATSAPEQPTGTVSITVTDEAGNASEVLSLAYTGMPTVEDVQDEIAGYMQARAGHIIAAQPDLIGLLSGNVAGAFNADVTKGLGNFEFVSNGKRNVWANVSGNWSTTDGNDNSYYFGVVGAHVTLSPDALVGVMVQFDKLTQENGDTQTKGNGYLVGPYFVAKAPGQPLYFEGRILKGASDNTVSIDGFAPQDFSTDTTLISGKVAGKLDYKNLVLTPNLTGTYFKDTQNAFTDTASRAIEEQSITVKEMALGLDASKQFFLSNGDIVLTAGATSIWSHTSGTGYAATVISPYDGQRGRLTLDTVYTGANRISVTAGTYYDGLGTDDYEAWGLQMGVNMSF
jgi:hypothetical protein